MKREPIYETMDLFRKSLNEMSENNNSTDGVPYTNQDEILGQFMDSARQQFGANFSNTENPMLYIPQNDRDSENVIFRGEIGKNLNNAKFEMELNGEKSGCRVYTNNLELTDENVNILKVVLGFYNNWKEQLSTMADKKPMSVKGNDVDETPQQQNQGQEMVAGDDFGSR